MNSLGASHPSLRYGVFMNLYHQDSAVGRTFALQG